MKPFRILSGLCFVGLLICMVPAHAQRKVWAKNVAKMELVLDGPTTLYGAIPGEKISFDVIVTTKKGKSYSLKRKTLSTKRMVIEAVHMSVDMDSLTLTPDKDQKRIGSDQYEMTVLYGKGKRQTEATETLNPDFRALFGPHLNEIRSIDFKVLNNPDDRFLIPGNATEVEVVVIDKGGQAYKSDGSFPKLPAHIYQMETVHASWDHKNHLITPEEKGYFQSDEHYEMSIAVKDLPQIRNSHTYIPDFAFKEGPQPEDVVAMGIDLPGQNGGESIAPGANLVVAVWAEDSYGRKFYSTGEHTYKLPTSRYTIEGENLKRMGSRHSWKASDDFQAMVSQSFVFKTGYVRRDNMATERSFAPDFMKALYPFIGKEMNIESRGSVGRSGHTGQSGTSGVTGATNKNRYSHGSDGQHGSHGNSGTPGGPGGKGSTTRIKAIAVRAIGMPERQFLLVELIESGKAPSFFLQDLEGQLLSVSANGGEGGHGGSGGQGGSGGRGGTGFHPGSGGNGGNGGNGSNGGRGGQGGTINLRVSSLELADYFDLAADGGQGGKSGSAGDSGRAGSAGSHHNYHKVEGVTPPDYQAGRAGMGGNYGQQGQEGTPGSEGRTSVAALSPTEGEALWRRAPQKLKRQLVIAK